MLTMIKMAWKNIFRYKNRTIITILAIAISVFIAVVIDALLMGIFNQSNLNMVNYEASEAVIYANGYLEEKDKYPLDLVIDSTQREQIESLLRANKVKFAPRYRTTAELVFYDEDKEFEGILNVLFYGVSDLDKEVFQLESSLESGTWIEEGDDSIVVGSGVADKLGLKVGDLLTLQCEGKDGYAQSVDVLVKGIVNTENYSVNSSMAYMALDQVDSYLGLEGCVNMYAISDGKMGLASSSFAASIKKLLKSVDGVQVYSFEEDNEGYMAILNGDKGSSYLVLIFLFIIAGAGIVNTMVMSVLERRKETAMLRAMGFSNGSIKLLFVSEGFIIGVVGAVVGLILGAAVNYPLAKYGINLEGAVEGNTIDIGYRISLIFKATWSTHSFVVIPLLGVALTVLASYFPVSRIGKGQIANMLRRV